MRESGLFCGLWTTLSLEGRRSSSFWRKKEGETRFNWPESHYRWWSRKIPFFEEKSTFSLFSLFPLSVSLLLRHAKRALSSTLARASSSSSEKESTHNNNNNNNNNNSNNNKVRRRALNEIERSERSSSAEFKKEFV